VNERNQAGNIIFSWGSNVNRGTRKSEKKNRGGERERERERVEKLMMLREGKKGITKKGRPGAAGDPRQVAASP